jgi:hypothetical protein
MDKAVIETIKEAITSKSTDHLRFDFEELTISEDDFRDFRMLIQEIELEDGFLEFEDRHQEYDAIVFTGVEVSAPAHLLSDLVSMAM